METGDPNIYLSQDDDDDTFHEIFRRLSHKVAGCRYDIPWGSKVIVAYAKSPNSMEPAEAVGVITFSIADEAVKSPSPDGKFTDSYFHTISFLFVDKRFQRKGIGTYLLNETIRTIRNSEIQHPIHLEAAKPAVKFFKKMGFTLAHKMGKVSGRGSRLFKECFFMERLVKD